MEQNTLKSLFKPNKESEKTKLKRNGGSPVKRATRVVSNEAVRGAESSKGRIGIAFSNMLVSLKNVVVSNLLQDHIPLSANRFSASCAGSSQASKQGYDKLLVDMDSPFLPRRHLELTERVSSFSTKSSASARGGNRSRSSPISGTVIDHQVVRRDNVHVETNNNSTQCSWSPPVHGSSGPKSEFPVCCSEGLVELEDYDEDEFSGSETSEDSSSWVEDFSCLVCERAFFTARQLERHQLKKRHWGCGECDRRFNSLILLEYHKDELNHWSEEDFPYDSEDDDFDSLREVMNDVRGDLGELHLIKMIHLKSCWSPCFWHDNVRDGAMAVAAYTVTMSVCLITYIAYIMLGGDSSQLFLPFFESNLKGSLQVAGGVAIFLFIILAVLGIFLSLGIRSHIRGLIIPWEIAMLTVLAFQAIYGLWLIFGYYIYLEVVFAAACNWLWMGLNFYCLLVVRSHYNNVRLIQSPEIEYTNY
eukprot:snap_masked-scaffold708_size108518-processed-gene-0.2 protein:Tk11258 transcript:snap_masked-scaffold708_size108518-processed-gene-0.2-mRNA-1 annotation:"PREDICTED: uncharacterized protein LOC100123324"